MPWPLVPGTGMPSTFFLRLVRLRPSTAPAAAPATAVTTGTPTALTAVQPALPAVCAALVTVSTGELDPLLDAVRELPLDDDARERELPLDDDARERELPPDDLELPLDEERDAVARFCPWAALPDGFAAVDGLLV